MNVAMRTNGCLIVDDGVFWGHWQLVGRADIGYPVTSDGVFGEQLVGVTDIVGLEGRGDL